jgi:SET domain-containing protein
MIAIREDASPGDFIAEYIGELISHEESDRRSHVYDRLKISYLFTLNESLIIDSYHKGNVTR